mmetsp:Transcript_65405/g.168332  ORF Transcript_65405/g.168332 Transcript_65405/m.168332 type:complete len:562 (+) Transcript_65405:2001-3686(+)
MRRLPPTVVGDARATMPMAVEPVAAAAVEDAPVAPASVARERADGVPVGDDPAEVDPRTPGAHDRGDRVRGAVALAAVDPRLRAVLVDAFEVRAGAAVVPAPGLRMVVAGLEPVGGLRREGRREDHALRAARGARVLRQTVVLLLVERRGAGRVRQRDATLRRRDPRDLKGQVLGIVRRHLAGVDDAGVHLLLVIAIAAGEDAEEALDALQRAPLALAVLLHLLEDRHLQLPHLFRLLVAAPVAFVAGLVHQLGKGADRALQRALLGVARGLLLLPRPDGLITPGLFLRVVGPALVALDLLDVVADHLLREPAVVAQKEVAIVLRAPLGLAVLRLGHRAASEALAQVAELAALRQHDRALRGDEFAAVALADPVALLQLPALLVVPCDDAGAAAELLDDDVGLALRALAHVEVSHHGVHHLLRHIVGVEHLHRHLRIDERGDVADELVHARRRLVAGLHRREAGDEAVDLRHIDAVAHLVLNVLEGLTQQRPGHRHVDPGLHPSLALQEAQHVAGEAQLRRRLDDALGRDGRGPEAESQEDRSPEGAHDLLHFDNVVQGSM